LLGRKENYLEKLAKRKNGDLPKVKEQLPKKRGRPLLVGKELDSCICEIMGLLLIQQL